MSETVGSSVTQCHHIKTTGRRCGSPAVRGARYCFYHLGARKCLSNPHGMFVERGLMGLAAPPVLEMPIPFLDDPAAIQIAYMQVLYGITTRRLDLRQARLVLNALNGACKNLKQMDAFVRECAEAAAPKDKKKQALLTKQAQARARNQRKAGA